MTTNIPDQLRADAIALGGAYSRVLDHFDYVMSKCYIADWHGDMIEILRSDLQHRRTIDDLKAQHDREIAEHRRRADADALRIKTLETRIESLLMARQEVRIA